jgi:hypothetical protein
MIQKQGRVTAKKGSAGDPVFEDDWVKDMVQKYKTRIKLKRKKKGGMLEIHFHSEEELIRIVDLLMPR